MIETAKNIQFPHAFSTRIGGVSEGIFYSQNLGLNRGDSQDRVIENWRRFLEEADISRAEFVCGNQVHGNHVHVASSADLRPAYGAGKVFEADGFVTNERNVPLSVFTADCVPLLLEDHVNQVIGAIHCGWRSTVADIEKEAISKMLSLGANAMEIHAAIGPAIDKCCFEVGPEVIDKIDELVDNSSRFYNSCGEKYMLDLRGVVRERLIELGILADNIELVGECTFCNPDKYWSHRYTKGNRGSLACIIEIV